MRSALLGVIFITGCRGCEQPQAAPVVVDASRPVQDASIVDAANRPPGPWPSVEVYCQAHPDGCVISALPDPDMKTVKVTDDEYETTWLALRTAAGWWAQSVMLMQDERKTGFTNPAVTIEALRVERPEKGVPFVLVERSWFEESPTFDPEKHTQTLHLEAGRDVRACRFDRGYPDCTEKHELANVVGDPTSFAWDAGKPTIPSRPYTIDPEGKLVLGAKP